MYDSDVIVVNRSNGTWRNSSTPAVVLLRLMLLRLIMKPMTRAIAALAAVLLLDTVATAAEPYPPYPPPPPPRSAPPPPRYYYPPPRVVDPTPPPLSLTMRVVYAPFYVAGLVVRYGFYYVFVAPLEVFGRTVTYGAEGGVERSAPPPRRQPPPEANS